MVQPDRGFIKPRHGLLNDVLCPDQLNLPWGSKETFSNCALPILKSTMSAVLFGMKSHVIVPQLVRLTLPSYATPPLTHYTPATPSLLPVSRRPGVGAALDITDKIEAWP